MCVERAALLGPGRPQRSRREDGGARIVRTKDQGARRGACRAGGEGGALGFGADIDWGGDIICCGDINRGLGHIMIIIVTIRIMIILIMFMTIITLII